MACENPILWTFVVGGQTIQSVGIFAAGADVIHSTGDISFHRGLFRLLALFCFSITEPRVDLGLELPAEDDWAQAGMV
jgi:hypothetical protein